MTIPSVDELELHVPVTTLPTRSAGFLLTGVTGSGKSTTLAAIIDYMNRREEAHRHDRGPDRVPAPGRQLLINQREIGQDTRRSSAPCGASPPDPDVILVGEMRDAETFDAALTAAETGHLVLSTLHTVDRRRRSSASSTSSRRTSSSRRAR